MEIKRLLLSDLLPPDLIVRAKIDERDVESLAWSMKAIGLINPIEVFAQGDKWEIATGHRRFLAAQSLGWDAIDCKILTGEAEIDSEAHKLHENLYRTEVLPLEEAAYFFECMEKGASVEDLALVVRHPESYIKARLKLLELPGEILKALAANQINVSVACVLAGCKSELGLKVLLQHAINEGVTTGIAREWVQNQNFVDGFADQPNVKGLPPDVASQVEVDRMWRCLICNSDEDKHTMKATMVHGWCLRMMYRQTGRDDNGQPLDGTFTVVDATPDAARAATGNGGEPG